MVFKLFHQILRRRRQLLRGAVGGQCVETFDIAGDELADE